MVDTRRRLIDGAFEVIRTRGIARTSARTVAAEAGVNQALIFYHFGSLADLLVEACRTATEARVAVYRERFARVGTLRELLALGRVLHAEERQRGNVTVLAQVLAGAQTDERLAPAAAASVALWTAEVERVARRLLTGSPVAAAVDVPSLARAVSAAFIGLELYEGVDPEGAAQAFTSLDRLAVLVEVLDDLGPVATATLRRKLGRAAAAPRR